MKNRIQNIFRLLLILTILAQGSIANAREWKEEIIYFILIDRFYDGDRMNDFDVNTKDPRGFHGGDIEGIIQKLDYLQNLGVTALWVSPVFKNRPMRFFEHQPYHGYWVWDFFSTDSRFGDMEKLRRLSNELHRRNMKLILDMVVNHADYNAPIVDQYPSWFHPFGNITDWNDARQVRDFRVFGLPDFASEKKVVGLFFQSVAKYWYDEIQPDGFRLDAVKHVPLSFWENFNRSIINRNGNRFLLLGEMLDGNPDVIADTFTKGRFTSLFDYPLYYSLHDVIAKDGDFREMGVRLFQDRKYEDANQLATFLDNHDLERFMTSCGNNHRRYRLALAFLLTARGIPTLTYGNEVGLDGAQEPTPLNRRDMVFEKNPDILEFTRKLIDLRKSSEALSRGIQVQLSMDRDTYAFTRFVESEQAIVLFNKGKTAHSFAAPLWAPLPEGTQLKNVAGTSNAAVERGKLVTTLEPESFAVFIAGVAKNTYRELLMETIAWKKNPRLLGMRKFDFSLRGSAIPPSADVFMIGDIPELGEWKADGNPPKMTKVGDGCYEVSLSLPFYSICQFKFMYKDHGKVVWQDCANTILEVESALPERYEFNW